MEKIVADLLSEYKNFVFIGEAGSGKTEVALSLALAMTEGGRRVHFFDMDQTKPLFRARGAAETMEREGVAFHFQSQYMDAPTVAPAVIETLLDESAVVLMDVGGGAHGAHMIGQFSHILNRDDACVLYVMNPYRAWSGTGEDVSVTRARVTGDARLSRVHIAANPNFGPATTAEDVINGEKRLRELTGGEPMVFLSVLESLKSQVEGRVPEPLLPIRLNTLPEWLRD